MFFLLVLLPGLFYLSSYLLTTMGLDDKTSTYAGGTLLIMLIVIIRLITVYYLGPSDNDNQDEDDEIAPPAYDEVIDNDEQNCPSNNHAVEMGG